MVNELIGSIEDKARQDDAKQLMPLMEDWSGYRPHSAGAMIGFGHYHYKYDSGREGDFFVTGFAPRKQKLVIYIMSGFDGMNELLDRLGKHKLGKSCLYVNRLKDVDLAVLEQIVKHSVSIMQSRYECMPLNEKL